MTLCICAGCISPREPGTAFCPAHNMEMDAEEIRALTRLLAPEASPGAREMERREMDVVRAAEAWCYAVAGAAAAAYLFCLALGIR